MAINDITLAGGMRTNLISLQMVSTLQARTTERLATGKRVNSAVDDPSAYFAAQNHRNRANDLAARKDQMGEAIQTVKAALQGIEGITKLIEQAKGLAASARSASSTDRAALATQFNSLRTQIDEMSNDGSYKGTNFLSSGNLTVDFNEDGSSSLTISGFDASSAGLSIAAAQNAWVADGDIDVAVTDLDAALTTLRTNAKTLASNNGVVTSRQEFTTQLISTLTTGADVLTAADTNEEGANMLALQTRQQLGIVALQLSSQAQQSIMRLF
ncbi:MAG: flagellin [Candidatus Eisenbacteria bacterium]|uniref:Flagellin n=1 Tax=Eiseniibacteriota bacterium TaxID=2212470 RepID=A0A933SJG8_UNCEI|nr:flagellin [Candidatus Eisenbacteria bacterium]